MASIAFERSLLFGNVLKREHKVPLCRKEQQQLVAPLKRVKASSALTTTISPRHFPGAYVPDVSYPGHLGLRDFFYDQRGNVYLYTKESLSAPDFVEFVRLNKGLKINHRNRDLLVVHVVSPRSCSLEGALTTQLFNWNMTTNNNQGIVLPSRGGFALPSLGSKKKGEGYLYYLPDVSAFRNDKDYWQKPFQSDAIAIGAPEFVIEVATDPSDLTSDKHEVNEALKSKMVTYGKDNCKLGYIFDYRNKEVWKYFYSSPDYDHASPIRIKFPKTGDVTGEDVLPGFVSSFEMLEALRLW